MALYLIRHGQTDWNVERRFQAGTDIPLNETGRIQAENAGRALAGRSVRFALLRSSPLSRARETAAIILSHQREPAAPCVIDPRLREVGLGDFEGRRASELRAELGAAFEHWRSRYFRIPAPGGESMEAAMARVAPVLEEIAPAARDADVALVAHQAINVCLAMLLLAGSEPDPDPARLTQANDEIDVWDVGGGRRIERIPTGGSAR